MSNANQYIASTIQIAEEKGYTLTAGYYDNHFIYTFPIRLRRNYEDKVATFSTYPGFCGGAMMYYIPSVNHMSKEQYELLQAACKEFINERFRKNNIHVIVAYASDEDCRGQEQFLEDLGFKVVDEIVSVKTDHQVKRFELVLPSQEAIDRAEANHARYCGLTDAYDEAV